jgi:hypothetical protein
MKKHNGMRPQDIVLLMGIVSLPQKNNKQLAKLLQISESEVSESLHRSEFAGLIEDTKLKKINRNALFEFIKFGIRYVFPVQAMNLGRGIATAHSAEPLKSKIISDEYYVWAHPEGNIRGQIIEPLYHTLPFIVSKNPVLYELMALVDAVRTGTARVVYVANQELETRLLTDGK